MRSNRRYNTYRGDNERPNIEDAARGVVLLYETNDLKHKVFNIATGIGNPVGKEVLMKSSKFVAGIGKTGRIIAGRILPDNDIIEAFEEACMAFGVKYGEISTSIGSLRNVVFNYVSRTTPAKGQGHATNKIVEGACGLLSGQGIISPSEEKGRMNIHYHAVVSDKDNRVFGGHIEKGTITLSTCDFIISEMKSISIKREKDPKTGIIFSYFR